MVAEPVDIGKTDNPQGVWLRGITADDLPLLVNWKNSYRQNFFFQQELTMQDQEAWFSEYLDRAKDFMFIIMQSDEAVGCIGLRHIGDYWDVYNVISKPGYSGGASIIAALVKITVFAKEIQDLPITGKVLRSNHGMIHLLKSLSCKVISTAHDHVFFVYSP
jgi:RimJ/RimL family protein N-acetyltransferase